MIGKAEYLSGGENPRFVVTSLDCTAWEAQALYEELYCAQGTVEDDVVFSSVASGYPYQDLFHRFLTRIQAAYP